MSFCQVFPLPSVAKITRQLVQRIFIDHAFGIQHRVDQALASSNLSLGDFLDTLTLVREKLTALLLMLTDLCLHSSLLGMGSESSLARVSSTLLTKRKQYQQQQQHSLSNYNNDIEEDFEHNSNYNNSNSNNNSNNPNRYFDAVHMNNEIWSEFYGLDAHDIEKSEAEIRRFLEDQVKN